MVKGAVVLLPAPNIDCLLSMRTRINYWHFEQRNPRARTHTPVKARASSPLRFISQSLTRTYIKVVCIRFALWLKGSRTPSKTSMRTRINYWHFEQRNPRARTHTPVKARASSPLRFISPSLTRLFSIIKGYQGKGPRGQACSYHASPCITQVTVVITHNPYVCRVRDGFLHLLPQDIAPSGLKPRALKGKFKTRETTNRNKFRHSSMVTVFSANKKIVIRTLWDSMLHP